MIMIKTYFQSHHVTVDCPKLLTGCKPDRILGGKKRPASKNKRQVSKPAQHVIFVRQTCPIVSDSGQSCDSACPGPFG